MTSEKLIDTLITNGLPEKYRGAVAKVEANGKVQDFWTVYHYKNDPVKGGIKTRKYKDKSFPKLFKMYIPMGAQ